MVTSKLSADEFVRVGFIVPVHLSPWAGPENRSEQLRGLIDTGADISMVIAAHAIDLGLELRGDKLVGGFGGTRRLPLYAAQVWIADAFGIQAVLSANDYDGVDPGFDVLIGRDLLSGARLVIDATGPVVTLTIDFSSKS